MILKESKVSKKDISPVVVESKLCEYEVIRQKNIMERERLFQELKIAQMKVAVSQNKPTKTEKK